MDYKIVKSKRRKSIALQVIHGEVIVRVPHLIDLSIVEQVIKTKERWLRSKVAQQRGSSSEHACFENGSTIWLAGEKKVLSVSYGDKHSIIVQGSTVNVSIKLPAATKLSQVNNKLPSREVAKKKLEAWYKRKAYDYISARIDELSSTIQLFPSVTKIRQYKARWGSCNNKGEVSFNYLLMMAPEWVVDYVIIHELCHLEHLNHSANFWALVKRHYPNFKEAKKWLRENQTNLRWTL